MYFVQKYVAKYYVDDLEQWFANGVHMGRKGPRNITGGHRKNLVVHIDILVVHEAILLHKRFCYI